MPRDTSLTVAAAHEILLADIQALGGAASLEQLKARGLTTADVQYLVRQRLLRRVRRGAYVHEGAWSSSRQQERLALTATAVVRSMNNPERIRAVVSHRAAAALWGLPLLGGWHKVDLMLLTGQRKGDPLVRFHCLEGPWVTGTGTRSDVPLSSPALTVLQVAGQSGTVAGVVVGDAALHRGLCTQQEISSLLEALRRPGPSARQIIPLLDGRSESPGESLVRIHLAAADIRVVPQVVIRDGSFTARVDLLVEGTNLVIEFDGNIKYETSGGSALIREKRREDRLRELGYQVLRIAWSDLQDVPRLVQRVRQRLQFATRTPPSASQDRNKRTGPL